MTASNPTQFNAPSAGGYVEGDNAANVILGSMFSDTLYGEGGDDTLAGGDGDDLLNGGQGNDHLTGGAGVDRFEVQLEFDGIDYISFGQDVIRDFGDGDMLDLMSFGGTPITLDVSYSATDTVLTFGLGTAYESTLTLENYIVPEWDLPFDGLVHGHLTFMGTQDGIVADDYLVGLPDSPDYLYGGAGNDTLDGFGGGDHLDGGSGNDSLSSVGSSFAGGFNNLYGGTGDDTLAGGQFEDWLYGGADQDSLIGGAGMDSLFGEDGDDTLAGGDGDDLLNGGQGNDHLTGGAGVDRFEVQLEFDGIDYISFGQDVIRDFGDGDMLDLMSFGGTPITLDVSYSATDTVLTFGLGTAYESTLTLENYIVPEWDLPFDGLVHGHLTFMGTQDGIVADDYLVGLPDSPDYLYGGAGNDTLDGFGGGDHLDGGSGNDSLSSVGSSFAGGFNNLYGGTGDDTLAGGQFEDWLYGGADQDSLIGGAGMDSLFGEDGDDTLAGGDGDDLLNGGQGNDHLTGGAGVDRFEVQLEFDGIDYISFGQDVIRGFGDGDMLDLMSFGGTPITLDVSYSATDTVLTFGLGTAYESTLTLENYIVPEWDLPFDGLVHGHLTFMGTQDGIVADDYLVGLPDSPDYLYGGAGNDTLDGFGGGDHLDGGSGNDSLSSVGSSFAGGFNNLYGGTGDDTLAGGQFEDWLYGGADQDSLIGGAGMDSLFGEDGDDTLAGGDGDDLLNGGQGNDHLTGGAGVDRFEVQLEFDGIDYISFGQDVIRGFGDGDMLDLMSFGGTPITLDVSYSATDTVLTFGLGTAYESTLTLENYIVPEWDLPFDGLVHGHLTFMGTQDGIVADDYLVGLPDSPDYLYGGAGNDTLDGFGGGDHLDGGSGNDSLSSVGSSFAGGFNNLYGGTGDDTLAGGQFEDWLYGGADQDSLIGGAGMDSLFGEDGDDTLAGGDGDDLLNGGQGNDHLTGGAGVDRFEVQLEFDGIDYISFGQDVIRDFGDGDMLDLMSFGGTPITLDVSYSATDTVLTFGLGTAYESTLTLENYIVPEWDLPFDGLVHGHLTFMGTQDGIVADDYLVGLPDSPDYLYGGAGNDTLDGFGGGDHLDGGSGNDSLSSVGSSFAGGFNNLYGGTGDDTLAGGQFEDWLYGGADQDSLIGGAGMDSLFGEDGDDTLAGGDGDDLLNGGQGNDHLTGGAGVDRFEFIFTDIGSGYESTGADVISDFGDGDMLEIIGAGMGSLDAMFTLQGDNTVIELETGTSHASTITIENYHVNSDDWIISGESLMIWGVHDSEVF